ncbi:MAG: hypothetical protein A3F10_06330 [Coxiella sp. RIFCSPHIGHO2_12_FULL_42_15]|nr:MAG: hypothetical protein A3F10_06330 [Coxiella sp. RIFCSPHIGHO2_12_FULL_42_15]
MIARAWMWFENFNKSTTLLMRRSVVMEWQFKLVFLLAILFMIYVQLYYPFFDPGGDSDTDFFMARYLLDRPGGLYISSHTPGMALFLIFSGVIFFETWKIMMVLYAAMSVAIPCMIYLTVRKYSRMGALLISIIVIGGSVPFAYSRVESYDHLFLFLEFLSILLVGLYFSNPSKYKRIPYVIALVMFGLTLVKPVAAFLYWIFLISSFFLKAINRKNILLATLSYLALMGVWVVLDRNVGNGNYPEWYRPQNLDQRRFAEIYFKAHHFNFISQLEGKPVVKLSDGLASKALYQATQEYVEKHEKEWAKPDKPFNNMPYTFFGKFAGHPDQLVQEIFKKPNALYFNFIVSAAHEKWADRGDALLYSVASEQYATGLLGLAHYFSHNVMKLITGPVVSLGWRNLMAVYSFAPTRKNADWSVIVDLNSVPSMMLNPNAGLYSKEFFATVKFFMNDLPEYWEHTNSFFDKFHGQPDKLFNTTFSPMGDVTLVEGWYYTLFMCIYGPVFSNELFTHVTLETMQQYPMTLLFFVDNFLKEALSFTKIAVSVVPNWYQYFLNHSAINYSLRTNLEEHIGPNLYHELQPEIYPSIHSHLIATLYGWMHSIAPIFSAMAIFLLGIAAIGRARPLAIFLLLVYLNFVVVYATFGNFGCDRYSDIFILIPPMIIVIALGTVKEVWKMVSKNTSLLR